MGERRGKISEGTGGSRRRRLWMVVAAALTVGGVAGAVVAAGSTANTAAQKSRQSFVRSSADVASTLQLAIQHEDDLVVSASAFVSSNPDASNRQFVQWASSVHAFSRYPELVGFGHSVIVPAVALPAFEAHAVVDPAGTLTAKGAFKVIPPGNRPFYCLSTLTAERVAAGAFPAGFDFCASKSVGPASLAARDSGQGLYTPITNGAVTTLAVQTPIYRGGVIPGSVAARRAAFEGWLGMSTVPKVLLDRALQGHPHTAVTFRYQTASSNVVFSAGTAPRHAGTATFGLHNGWTVTTFGAVASGGLWDNGGALALLFAGVVVSVLLGLMVLVLATGRDRALRMVGERTAQLRGAQAQLVDTARQAGMAEIATNVLHNVGNVLNSVNVSANLVGQQVRESKAKGLARAVSLLEDHANDLGEYLTIDDRGKALPGYLGQLASTLASERETIEAELRRLSEGVTHITQIVAAQQSLAGLDGLIEAVDVGDVVEDALHMAGGAGQHGLTVTRDVPALGAVALDRHRVLLILVNLISNAMHAMSGNNDCPSELRLGVEVTASAVNITVVDNGEGIAPENLTRIFVHGFTTHRDGHGFGLHSSAIAAQEMGGALTVHSDGPGRGAEFTLAVPFERQMVPA